MPNAAGYFSERSYEEFVSMNDHSREKDPAGKKALRLLASRPRTEREMILRLSASGSTGEDVRRVVEKLKAAGLIDDRKFSREWIASRMRTSPRGKKMLRQELIEKGVPSPIAAEVLEEMPQEFDELRTAFELAGKRLSGSSTRGAKEKARLYRYLCSRGFDEEIVERVLEELIG
ncbi:MAG: regulatory protein RecX [Candidatus Omnitrophica bacterium]|nr:regulatory protein RecX [Candidatus Omnitrophota bacterium]